MKLSNRHKKRHNSSSSTSSSSSQSPSRSRSHGTKRSKSLKSKDHPVQVLSLLQGQGHTEPKGQSQGNRKDHQVHLIQGQGHMVRKRPGHTSQGQRDMLLHLQILTFLIMDILIDMGILESIRKL